MGQHCYSRDGVLNIPEKQNYIILLTEIKFLESYLMTTTKSKRNSEERERKKGSRREGGRERNRQRDNGRETEREEGEMFEFSYKYQNGKVPVAETASYESKHPLLSSVVIELWPFPSLLCSLGNGRWW